MLVSIITPFLNEEQTLAILLERAPAAALPLGMTREFVFVDDGSRDGLNAIAADFVRRNPDIARLVTLPSNLALLTQIGGKARPCEDQLTLSRSEIAD